jgi:hypothetical protein
MRTQSIVRRTTRVAALLALTWAGLLLSSAPARADLITFQFEGIVTSVVELTGFNVGDPISGTYTFESTTSDLFLADLTLGGYLGAVTDLSFVVSGYTGSFGPGFNAINIGNPFGASGDIYQVNSGFTGASVSGFDPEFFALDIRDSTGTALSSDLLPTTPPNLALFDTRVITLGFEDDEDSGFVIAQLTSLTRVPVPPGLLLLASGLAGLVALRRMRK